MTIQERIDHIQAIYKEWLVVKEKLKQAEKDWQRSLTLVQELNHFYFDGEWRELYEQIEQGLEIDLTTDGEYSVMSEDTLWNVFHEQQIMLWKNLRFSVQNLDKDYPDFDEESCEEAK